MNTVFLVEQLAGPNPQQAVWRPLLVLPVAAPGQQPVPVPPGVFREDAVKWAEAAVQRGIPMQSLRVVAWIRSQELPTTGGADVGSFGS